MLSTPFSYHISSQLFGCGGVSALRGRALARSVAFRPPLLPRRSFECSPRSCVALQALPVIRVNKLISTTLWLRVALWGRGEHPIPLLWPRLPEQARLKAGFGGMEVVCSPGAVCPSLFTSCFSTADTSQNRVLHGEEVASILGPLPPAAALFSSHRAAGKGLWLAGGTGTPAPTAPGE